MLEFYSGATGLPGRFTEGFSLRRLHRSLKNQILLENYYLPGQLEALTQNPKSEPAIS